MSGIIDKIIGKEITIPYSELALHYKIAGKKGRVVSRKGRFVTVEVEGRHYEGLLGELIGV